MHELKKMKITIESFYDSCTGEERQLKIEVSYDGRHYSVVDYLWNEDAVSVLDHCFDRAKREISSMIEAERNKESAVIMSSDFSYLKSLNKSIS